MPGGPVAAGGGIGVSGSKNKLAGIAMTAFAAFGGILFGYDTGVISGVKEMKDWLEVYGDPTTDTATYQYGYYLPSNRESLVVSILSAGTFFGMSSPASSLLFSPSHPSLQVPSSVLPSPISLVVVSASSAPPSSSASASLSKPAR